MSKLMGVDLLYYKVGLQTDAHIDTIKGMNDRMCIGMWIGKCLFEKNMVNFGKPRLVENADEWIQIHGRTALCEVPGFTPWRALIGNKVW